MPSSRAASATGGEASLRPLPFWRSGGVDDQLRPVRRARQRAQHRRPRSRRCRGRRCAPGRRQAGETSGVRSVAGVRPLAQDAQRLAALLLGRRDRSSACRRDGRSRAGAPAPRGPKPRSMICSPCSSWARDPHVQRALDVDGHAGQAEAALLGDLHLLRRSTASSGLTTAISGAVGAGAVDQHAVHHADLRRGQADAHRGLHQLRHARDLVGERVVELGHRHGRGLQRRVAEGADQRQRPAAALDAARASARGAPPRARTRPRPFRCVCSSAHRCASLATDPAGSAGENRQPMARRAQ